MFNKTIKTFYYNIHVSKTLAKLDALDDISDEHEYLHQMEAIHSDLLKIPSTHTDLLLTIKELIRNRNVIALKKLSADIRLFLNAHFTGLSSLLKSERTRKIITIAVIVLLISLVFVFYGSFKNIYLQEKEDYNSTANAEVYKQQTLKDILQIKEALKIYYNQNKSYPKSSGGWDAVIANYGESKADWIPGLAPSYIKVLPADPRQSRDPGKQYMYKSDGKDFKLISHRPTGIEDIIKTHPELIDPARPSWAFGVWTEGAKNW